MINTPRLRLRGWRDADREPFADMHSHPEVMHDYGGILTRASSDEKFDRYKDTLEQVGYSRWAIESSDGLFLGYTGLMPVTAPHPLGPHVDIGWRLVRSAWGRGYATEAAGAALEDAFARVGLSEVIAYTSPDNIRSQAVMKRLGLHRDPSRDYTTDYNFGAWHGMVWFKRSPRT